MLAWTGPFQALDERMLGASLKASGELRAREVVALLLMDEAACAQWNGRVPRTEVARVVRALTTAGAGELGFDFAYLQPDRDGPGALGVLADALRAHGRAVTGTVPLPAGGEPTEPIPAHRTLPTGPTPAIPYGRFAPPCGPVPEASALGTYAMPVSPAGRVRSAFALAEAEGRRVPSLALAMWLQARGLPLPVPARAAAGRAGGGRALPAGG